MTRAVLGIDRTLLLSGNARNSTQSPTQRGGGILGETGKTSVTSLRNNLVRDVMSLQRTVGSDRRGVGVPTLYHDVPRLVAMFNELLERIGATSRFHRIATDDQTAIVMCAAPGVARKLARRFKLKLIAKRSAGST